MSLPSGPAPRAQADDDIAAQGRSLRRLMLAGFAVVFLFVGGVGVWAATTTLSGAVVAGGSVVVETNVKTVQHPTGGVIAEIRVGESSRVAEGDLLIRLDDVVTRANLQVIVKQLVELEARQARLEAERDGLREFIVPTALAARREEPDVIKALDGERTLFNARLAAREGLRRQLQERIDQIREEIAGVTAQESARRRQVDLIQRELVDIGELFRRNLVPRTRLVELQREASRLAGDVGQLVAERARAEGRITESELQILQIDQDLRREVSQELREVQGRIGEFVERRVAAEDALKRIDIRAPQAGIVHQLNFHTIGGVIPPSQPIMQIVPADDVLVIETRIQPHEIDKVAIDQLAYVRFTSLPFGATPEILGRVTRVSPDIIRDPQANIAYFTARISVSEEELRKLGHHKIMPGLPAEIFIRTTERTALSYIIKPIRDQIARAFRES